MKLYVRDYGAGPPVIILHGLLGCGDNWHPVAKAMAEGRHVIVPDQRNHGRSPHSSEFNHPVLANDLDRLLERFKLETVSLIGHSMGGKTAMHFALTRPDRVRKLIIADIAPRPYRDTLSSVFDALLSVTPEHHSRRGDIDQALADQLPDPATRAFLLRNLKRGSSGHLTWRIDVDALRRNVPQILASQETLGSFAGPALFVRGESSDYVTARDAASIITLFPKARIVTIPNAGHWVHADAPNKFIATVTGFLDS